MLGKLSLAAIPLHEPLPLISGAVVVLIILAVLAFIAIKGWVPYLWREWLTSVDHKRIGVMYFTLGLVMLLRGFADAIMMRTQQAIAVGGSQGYLPPQHYDQIFSAHGTIMIFFVAMPLVIGLMNFVVPLQLGVRDVAFPVLNSVSFWLTASGALLINVSLVVGVFSRATWWGYPPLSELAFSPDVGVDYYLWSLQISGVGTLLTGVNFVTTILKLRAPGMTYFRMPVFCWTALAANLLIVAAFPVLTATFIMLLLDRYLGMHFFTNDLGGNQMMYANLFWAWGHPEVYILVLPAFGIYSEIAATFSGKGLFSYRSMVWATLGICILSFMVWLHHFFTMGAGADVNAFFGIMSSIIAVPTGVKIFNWLFTMFRGKVEFKTPMVWLVAFMVTFVLGGMTGVLLAVPPVDFVLHNSAFLVAHFHNVIIGGVVFGAFAGYAYWFPKAFGFTLDERWGKASVWFWVVGFYLAFVPLYMLGLMGMTRRLQHIPDPSWQPLLLVAEVGAVLVFCGILCQIIQLYVSIRTREQRRDLTGDPWNGRTLEWSTSSPPPAYNFAVLPTVETIDAFWQMKRTARVPVEPAYEPIEMPHNSPAGFITAFFAVIMGFSLIWQIWWLAILGFLAVAIVVLIAGWSTEREQEVSAAEIAHMERARGSRAARMTVATIDKAPPAVPGRLPRGRGGGGPATKRTVVAYGFWIFILSDMVMFSALFAAFAVLRGNTAGGPTGSELFNLRNVFIETMCLLFSSYTAGLGALSAERRQLGTLLDLRRPYVRARRGVSVHRGHRICRYGREGCRAVAQRVSVRVLHAGRHARDPRRRRVARADLSVGPGDRQGPGSPPCCGACCAGACSGTRWTSSGSGSSRWFI